DRRIGIMPFTSFHCVTAAIVQDTACETVFLPCEKHGQPVNKVFLKKYTSNASFSCEEKK
ncbi:MAG: hypothetical protein AAFV33_05820, partial [Chloroflexota bacterium]